MKQAIKRILLFAIFGFAACLAVVLRVSHREMCRHHARLHLLQLTARVGPARRRSFAFRPHRMVVLQRAP